MRKIQKFKGDKQMKIMLDKNAIMPICTRRGVAGNDVPFEEIANDEELPW
jgi:hypothetical protein